MMCTFHAIHDQVQHTSAAICRRWFLGNSTYAVRSYTAHLRIFYQTVAIVAYASCILYILYTLHLAQILCKEAAMIPLRGALCHVGGGKSHGSDDDDCCDDNESASYLSRGHHSDSDTSVSDHEVAAASNLSLLACIRPVSLSDFEEAYSAILLKSSDADGAVEDEPQETMQCMCGKDGEEEDGSDAASADGGVDKLPLQN